MSGREVSMVVGACVAGNVCMAGGMGGGGHAWQRVACVKETVTHVESN